MNKILKGLSRVLLLFFGFVQLLCRKISVGVLQIKYFLMVNWIIITIDVY